MSRFDVFIFNEKNNFPALGFIFEQIINKKKQYHILIPDVFCRINYALVTEYFSFMYCTLPGIPVYSIT